MDPAIKLSKEKRADLTEKIQIYFLKEREEELGSLAAGFILDFFIEKIGPEIYNQGVYDAYKYMNEKLDGMLEIQVY